MTLQMFLSYGAPQVPPKRGAEGTPNFFFFCPNLLSSLCLLPPPKAAVFKLGATGAPTRAPKAPKGGARGATPPEGEVNPTEGGCFASYS